MNTLEEAQKALSSNEAFVAAKEALFEYILNASEVDAGNLINSLYLLNSKCISPHDIYQLLYTYAGSKVSYLRIGGLCEEYFKSKTLTNDQISRIMFKSIVLSRGHTEFNHADLTIKNICTYIQTFCDSNNTYEFDLNFSKWYEFTNIEDKILYLVAMFGNINRYNLENVPLNYMDALELTERLESSQIAVDFVVKNLRNISKEQKLELLLKAAKFGQLFSLSLCELDLEPTILICKLTKSMDGLVAALIKAGKDKNTILSFIERFIQDLDLAYFQFQIDELKLSKEEIISFVQRNPGSGHIIDAWVSSQRGYINQFGKREGDCNLTPAELMDLLDLRLKNSEYFFCSAHLETYNIQFADLPALMSAHAEHILIDPVMEQHLDWGTIYMWYRRNMQNNLGYVVQLRESNKLSQQLREYFSDFPDDIEKIQEEYATSEEIIEHLTNVCLLANKNFGKIVDSAPSVVVLNKVTERLAIKDIAYENVMPYIMNVLWLVSLGARLLEEVEHKKLQVAFNNSAFATTLEEIANLAAPHLRNKFIDNIISLLNDEIKFDSFNALLAKANKRSHIPALIISSNVARPVEFVKIISLIGSEYCDNRNLIVLLNGLNCLFDTAEISDEDKLKIISKVLSYNLVIDTVDGLNKLQLLHAQRIAEDKIDYNTMYLTKVKLESGIIFSLQALDTNGRLVDLLDIKKDERLKSLNSLLNSWIKKEKKLERNIEEILSQIEKTHAFPCGFASEQQALLLLQGLAAINKLKVLVEDKQFYKNSWQDSYAAGLQICFDISTEALPKTMEQINPCREPFSLVAYYAQLKSLKQSGDKYIAMLKQYVDLISSPQARDFYNYRYNLQQQSQLRAALISDQHLLTLWRQGFSLSYDTFAGKIEKYAKSQQELKVDAYEFLVRQIKQFEHLSPLKFQFIHSYLNAVTPHDKLSAFVDCELALAKVKVGDNYYDKMRSNNLNLQLKLIEFFNTHSIIDDKQKLKLIVKIQNITDDSSRDTSQFARDMIYLTNILTAEIDKQTKNFNVIVKRISSSKWLITDTDNFWDMFRIGTDVIGSCQNVNGSPYLNRCLIGGYVLSGHVRQIAIIDENHEIVARAVFRMMRDAKTHMPVVFLEEVYPHQCNVEYQQAIEKFAILRAWQLGCPLVCKRTFSRDNLYPNPVEVVAVKVSEYVDGLGTEQTSGYEIADANLLFRPRVSRQQLPKMLCSYGLAMGRASYGPRPLANIQDLCFMYQNMRAKTEISIPEFYRRINLQVDSNRVNAARFR